MKGIIEYMKYIESNPITSHDINIFIKDKYPNIDGYVTGEYPTFQLNLGLTQVIFNDCYDIATKQKYGV